MATKTKPGICVFGLEVAASIAGVFISEEERDGGWEEDGEGYFCGFRTLPLS
jgi:hypothetical protein